MGASEEGSTLICPPAVRAARLTDRFELGPGLDLTVIAVTGFRPPNPDGRISSRHSESLAAGPVIRL
jgi:hypothetical protein